MIEVLVVVAIIALLLAILLPALGRAREQGYQTVCLAHLKQILLASGMYEQDHKGWIPFGPADSVYDYVGAGGATYRCMGSTCLWGGRRGEVHGPTLQPCDRPLTGYIYRRMQLQEADLFRCPSDVGSPLWEGKENRRLYETCGNSYYLNVHGEFDDPAQRPVSSTSRVVLYHEGNVAWLLGMYPQTLPWIVSPPVMSPPQQGRGWHGRFSRFNVGFRDLHAANTYMDTRQTSGSGWTVREFLRIWGFRVGPARSVGPRGS